MPLMRAVSLVCCLILTSSWLVACGGSKPPPPRPTTGSSVLGGGVGIRSVNVQIDKGSVSGDGVSALERYSIPSQIQSNVTSLLAGSGSLSPSGHLQVRIDITSFRLRSGASAFWLGMMSGADHLQASVNVEDGNGVVRAFGADTSTALGGLIYASPTKRSARLVKTLSQRIADGL